MTPVITAVTTPPTPSQMAPPSPSATRAAPSPVPFVPFPNPGNIFPARAGPAQASTVTCTG